MDALTLHRKARLQELVASKPYDGNQAKLAARAGLTKSRITQLLDPNDSFGERAAQTMCDKLNLPDRYFEEGFDAAITGASDPGTPAPPSLAQALEVVVTALELTSPELRRRVLMSIEALADNPGDQEERAYVLAKLSPPPAPGTETAQFAGKPRAPHESTVPVREKSN